MNRLLLFLGLLALRASAFVRAADGALSFGGVDGAVEVKDFDALGVSTEVTVEFWAKTNSVKTQAAFNLYPDEMGNRSWMSLNDSSGSTGWIFGDPAGGGGLSIPNRVNSLGHWTHYAVVASQSGGFMAIYVNGLRALRINTSNAFETGAARALLIGGGAGAAYDGTLDEFRIWNVARTEEEIAESLADVLTGNEAGLRLYFKFDEGSGTTAVNSAKATGTAFDGTLWGGTVWTAPASRNYVVTTAADENDTPSGTAVSLREALRDAGADDGPARIVFAPALSGRTVTVSSEIVIADAQGVVVDATDLPAGLVVDGGSGSNRLFSTSGVVALKDLILIGGHGGGAIRSGFGGAIDNAGLLTVKGCTVANNTASQGGGIANSGLLTTRSCTFYGNSAGLGGAIYSTYKLAATDCAISVNSATARGGAMFVESFPFTLKNCFFSGNTAGVRGGAIEVRSGGPGTFTGCSFLGNGSQGGSVAWNSSSTGLVFADCTVTGNSATLAAIASNSGPLTLLRSTLAKNTGGAIYSENGLTLTHCTLHNNGLTQYGGAIRSHGEVLEVTHCTLTQNSADVGGAIYSRSNFQKTTVVENSIVAGNTASSGADIFHSVAPNSTLSYQRRGANIIQEVETEGTVTDSGPAAFTEAPLLGPLADYGGPTPTMALLPGSPARDAAVGSTMTADQRGFPVVGMPDLGAYEAGTFSHYAAWIYETFPAGSSVSEYAAASDPDGDGQSNEDEYRFLTDPLDPASAFTPKAAANGGALVIGFATVPGRSYTLERSDELPAGVWTDTGNAAVAGDGTVHAFTIDTTSASTQRMFFRIRAEPSPRVR